ncbi:hypothetical protein M427DRAFT_57048 [Gonapodya prolifera JEL478]|uniref:Alpha/beta hydrolase fold-3 domain-containing protein n=1 Tax=Gonapodya prolifera (strain JEL478) TaxID=1344416 RepID=A0A139AEE0_GONPJ|nr:hypothetical protein M427DRAFT_57048 [Gonapodya prolifera JEL478]|eukprot:KXS15182.1 hypothetical protein M427DRAFT_57048 [Gonapodya prolifera JEL478]
MAPHLDSQPIPWPASWPEDRRNQIVQGQAVISLADPAETRRIVNSFPIPPVPEDIAVIQVSFPRIPSPGLEEHPPQGSINAEWVVATNPTGAVGSGAVAFYWHGGGYMNGSKDKSRGQAIHLARMGFRVLNCNYRLAPENPFPAAITDAFSVYTAVLAQGTDAGRIILAGTSAGAGLVYGLSLYLRDSRNALPAGLLLLTPFVDTTVASPSHNLPAEFRCCVLTTQGLHVASKSYLGSRWPELKRNRYASPLFADVDKAAPLPAQLIITGTRDRFLADNVAIGLKRSKDGLEHVQVEIYEDENHAFLSRTSEALVKVTLHQIATWCTAVLSGGATQTAFRRVREASPHVTEITRKDATDLVKELLARWKQDPASKAVEEDLMEYEAIVGEA